LPLNTAKRLTGKLTPPQPAAISTLSTNERRHQPPAPAHAGRWRTLDQNGVLLDILVQPRRYAKAAKRFFN
jgi:hypothetical protein